MWLLLVFVTQLLITRAETESSPGRVILRGGNGPCEGHVEIYIHGKWGIVGDQFWDRTTEEVVCRATDCGVPVEGQTENVLRPLNKNVWLNEVVCTGNEMHLLQCKYPGEGVSFYRKDTVKKIKCSRQIKITLTHSNCSGIVQFSFEGKSGHFCSEGFGVDGANVLCESLGCGTAKTIEVDHWMNVKESTKRGLNCADIDDLEHLWQCVTAKSSNCRHPASVTCQGHKRIRLRGRAENVCSGYLEVEKDGVWIPAQSNQGSAEEWCRSTHCGSSVNYSRTDNGAWLTCTDKVAVSVSFEAITNRCYGFVYVEMNDQKRAVCSNKWGRAESEVVCGELNCGHVVSHEQRPLQGKGIMDQVSCLGNETSIWHCRAMRSLSIACHNKVFVVCSESVDVRLKDGLGKFNGRLEILHGNMWMPVSKGQWEDVNLDVVCKQVGRRNSRRALEKYSTDSKNFPYRLQCNKNAVHISECITENATTSLLDAKPLEITCKEHKLLILKGDDPCSGLVVIEKKDQTYWLSGSNATWNQESANVVCQEKHCGNASSFYASFLNITNQTSVWDQSYNCSPGAKSLFDCETHLEQPSDHNSSIAAVKCSEKITISLQHQCWGEVSICMDGKCGSVCQESLSQVYPDLCKSLQCGEKVVKTSKILPKTNTTIKRLHQTRHTTNLTQSIFVMSEEHDICTPAYVVCSGSLKPRLSGVDRCSGNLEVFQEDTWLSVCKQDHSKNVHNAICQELQCGEEVEITQDTGPAPANTRFSNLKCNRNSQSLSECEVSTANKACKAAVLKCTGWRKMRTLNTCSGPVLVYSKGQRSAVAVEGWTEKEGERLCLDLQCGGFKSLKGHNTTEKLLFWNGSFRCENNETNIWACEKPTPPSEKQQLFIQCQDTPKVSLSENCHGLVKIDGIEVCNSFWNMEMSHMVCQEQNCSNAIAPTKTIGVKSNAKYYHVICDEFHHELGQCRRVKGRCGSRKELVSVNCIGSVWFSTDQRCGGQLKISYGDKLERVCPMDFSSKTSEDLCRALDCNGHNQTLRTGESTEKVNLETSFKCEQNYKDIRYCVTSKSCTGVRPAEIYCNGYEYLQPASSPTSPPSTAGHYEWLVLPILIVALIILICIVKKFKKTSLSKKEKVLSRKAAEIESGDYEEVHSDANEMEELDKRTSRSPTESLTAEQTRGSPSLTNGKEAEAQPLNSEHLEDEPYDDIDSGPEVTQTNAEIHQWP